MYQPGTTTCNSSADPIMASLSRVGKLCEGAPVDDVPKDSSTFVCPMVGFLDGATIAQTP